MDLLSRLEQEGLTLAHLSELVMLASINGRLSHNSLPALALQIMSGRDAVVLFLRGLFFGAWALGYGWFLGRSLTILCYYPSFR